MKFMAGLLVSLLVAMGIAACGDSNEDWTRNRAPSRESASRADHKDDECGEECQNLLETIDWKSLGDAQRAFNQLEDSGNIIIENVSKTVTLPTESKIPSDWTNHVGNPWNNAVKALTPNNFYLDQHFMVHGICDARSQEAIVFFFDPHFVGSPVYESTAGNEYQKVWSGGSATTDRSLPAPRFKFPLIGGIEQQESLGIKVVDKGSKSVIGAALIEVFVTQGINEIETLVEDEATTETWYVCNFDLRINRTYEKSEKPETDPLPTIFTAMSFQHEFVLPEGVNQQSNLFEDLGKMPSPQALSDISCLRSPARRARIGLMPSMSVGANDFFPIDQILESTISTETGIVFASTEFVDNEFLGPFPPDQFLYAFPDDPSNEDEMIFGNTDINGEPFYRTYAHIETDLSIDPTNDNFVCSVRFDSLELYYPMNNAFQKLEWPSKDQ
jgi:hypothetical protein